MDDQWLIQQLGLKPLPREGGFFAETYRSDGKIPADALPARYTSDKNLCTAIYYLLTPQSSSMVHRLPSDEIYHFYLGDPVDMLILHPNGSGEMVTLGNDIAAGENVQLVVPRGAWQGSYLIGGGRFALMGTTMAPGYDPGDLELGKRDELIRLYPDHAGLIKVLARE